ncbi:MAG TPA: hypothetical protein VHG27_03410, partial [Xanthobacteraceae bacterium]|nr:hypothetical protein [Xanthobacteraceae bacterium]
STIRFRMVDHVEGIRRMAASGDPAFMLLQGVAEVIRCILAIKANRWPARLHDVEEMETAILHEAQDRARAEAAKGGTSL